MFRSSLAKTIPRSVQYINQQDILTVEIMKIKPKLVMLKQMQDIAKEADDKEMLMQVQQEHAKILNLFKLMSTKYKVSIYDVLSKLDADLLRNQILTMRQQEARESVHHADDDQLFDLIDEDEQVRVRNINKKQYNPQFVRKQLEEGKITLERYNELISPFIDEKGQIMNEQRAQQELERLKYVKPKNKKLLTREQIDDRGTQQANISKHYDIKQYIADKGPLPKLKMPKIEQREKIGFDRQMKQPEERKVINFVKGAYSDRFGEQRARLKHGSLDDLVSPEFQSYEHKEGDNLFSDEVQQIPQFLGEKSEKTVSMSKISPKPKQDDPREEQKEGQQFEQIQEQPKKSQIEEEKIQPIQVQGRVLGKNAYQNWPKKMFQGGYPVGEVNKLLNNHLNQYKDLEPETYQKYLEEYEFLIPKVADQSLDHLATIAFNQLQTIKKSYYNEEQNNDLAQAVREQNLQNIMKISPQQFQQRLKEIDNWVIKSQNKKDRQATVAERAQKKREMIEQMLNIIKIQGNLSSGKFSVK